MNNLVEVGKDFKSVIITCRTQFFPSKVEEPDRTGVFTFGGTSGECRFDKLYLSAFDEKDIKSYLKKIYNPYNPFKTKRYKKALKIVYRSPNLVVRPMLLSYIKDLINVNEPFNFSFQVYEVLINKWLQREANKPGIQIKFGSASNYEQLLKIFTYELAWKLYLTQNERRGFIIDVNEKIENSDLQLDDFERASRFNISDIRSRSLLNRNTNAQYKFSHKSIMEYFLFKRLATDETQFQEFDFKGMNATTSFLKEFVLEELSKTGFSLIHIAKGNIYRRNTKEIIKPGSTSRINYKFIDTAQLIEIDFDTTLNIAYLSVFLSLHIIIIKVKNIELGFFFDLLRFFDLLNKNEREVLNQIIYKIRELNLIHLLDYLDKIKNNSKGESEGNARSIHLETIFNRYPQGTLTRVLDSVNTINHQIQKCETYLTNIKLFNRSLNKDSIAIIFKGPFFLNEFSVFD